MSSFIGNGLNVKCKVWWSLKNNLLLNEKYDIMNVCESVILWFAYV